MRASLLTSVSALILCIAAPAFATGNCIGSQCNTQNNSQQQQQGQAVDNVNSGVNYNDIYVQGDERETHSAYAPALSAGSDTCLGSTAAGVQGGLFGVSFGTNWTDQNCENIRSAKALYDMGEKQAALLVMCLANGGRNVVALEASGHDCSPVTDSETATVPAGHAGPVQTAEVTEVRTLIVKIER